MNSIYFHPIRFSAVQVSHISIIRARGEARTSQPRRGKSPLPQAPRGGPTPSLRWAPKGRQARPRGLRPPVTPGLSARDGDAQADGAPGGGPGLPRPHRPPGAEGSRPPRPLPAAVQAPPGPAAGQRRGAARRVPRGARGRAGPPGAGLPAAPCSGLGASVRLPPPASGTTEGDGQPGRPARPEDCPEGSSLGSSLRTQDPETPLPSHPASHKESNGEILDPGSASRISLLCGSRKEPLLGLRLPCSQ